MFNFYPKEKVYSFMKSENEEVQFLVSHRKGKTFADIQIFYIQEDGSKIGTQKGLYVPVEQLQAFGEGVDRLIKASHPKGAETSAKVKS